MSTQAKGEPKIDRQPVKSGHIVSAGYSHGTAHIEFKGGKVYEYRDVPEKLWQGFAETFDSDKESSGKYFAKHLRSLAAEPLTKK